MRLIRKHKEKVAEKFLKLSWFAGLDEDNAGSNRGNLFEALVRTKFSRLIELAMHRQSLSQVPKNARANQRKNYIDCSKGIRLNSKMTIVRVSELINDVKAATSKNKLSYSKHESSAPLT